MVVRDRRLGGEAFEIVDAAAQHRPGRFGAGRLGRVLQDRGCDLAADALQRLRLGLLDAAHHRFELVGETVARPAGDEIGALGVLLVAGRSVEHRALAVRGGAAEAVEFVVLPLPELGHGVGGVVVGFRLCSRSISHADLRWSRVAIPLALAARMWRFWPHICGCFSHKGQAAYSRKMPRRADIDPNEYDEILRRLRDARENAGLTQEELADALGGERGLINKIELKRRRIDAHELKLLCERLEVSADFILGIQLRAKQRGHRE